MSPTAIAGLLHVELELHADTRGWFKESYQRVTLEAAGLPRLEIVQNNVAYSAQPGVTRGIHAEPWNKYVSPAYGRAFCAIVDLRAGSAFGQLATFELGPGQGLYIPRGCGNSYCTLVPHTVYNYLVDGHWSADSEYVSVNLWDPALAVPWPLPRGQLLVSAKDAAHPMLDAVRPGLRP